MNDLIRKAVELADGWRYENDRYWGPLAINWTDEESIQGELKTMLYDALAAQLVRQVDALEDRGIVLLLDRVNSRIVDRHNRVHLSEEYGNDRTMNTIKAIVESGVLE